MDVSQGIYEHYKSTPAAPKRYQVLFLSHSEETRQVLVHYQPMYWDDTNDNAVYDDGITIWTRSLENFCENVAWKGSTVPRFRRVS